MEFEQINENDILSEFLSDEGKEYIKSRRKKRIIIALSITAGLVVCGVVGYLIYLLINPRKKNDDDKVKDAFKVLYEDKDVVKSLINRAKVKIIQLANGLNVTLISDEALSRCQAGIMVHTGSMDEGDIEGLAHLTEHMLFLGSTKYPDPLAYDNVLSQYKGLSNAMTNIALTMYYFDVLSAGFNVSLDMFSSMIKDPLLAEEYIDKEINAVDSEFDGLITNDNVREIEIIARLYGSHFTIGNNKSLRKNGTNVLMQKLKEFHQKFYFASNMHLILYSNDTIETLQNYSVMHFKDIPKGSVAIQQEAKMSRTQSQFDDYFNKMGKMLWFNPVMPIHFIEFLFTMPYVDIKRTPYFFIQYLFDDQNEKSFQTVMKNKNYIERMVTVIIREDEDHFELSFGIVLKEEGLSHMKEITEAFFSFVNMLTIEKIDEKIYEEFRSSTAQQTSFTPMDPDIENHLFNAYRIRRELKYVLDLSPWVNQKFDEVLIKAYLNNLNPKNCIISIGSYEKIETNDIKEYSTSPETFFTESKEDEYFETKYNIHEIKSDAIERLNNIKDYGQFSMRPSNQYISKENQLIKCKDSQEICDAEKKADAFELIHEKNLLVYYKTDRSFLLPKTSGRFRFIYPGIRTLSPETYTMNKLFFAYLQQKIKINLSDAFVTGNTFFLFSDENGIYLDITAFSDIFEKVIVNTLNLLFTNNLSQMELDGLLEELQLQRKNALMDSYDIGDLRFREIVKLNYRNDYGDIEITLDQTKQAFDNYSKSFIVYALFYGTINKETAMSVYTNALKGKTDPESVTVQKELGVTDTQGVIDYLKKHIPINGSFIYRARSPSPYEFNHAIVNLYYIGNYANDYKEIALANLIKVSWGRLFYNRLRTEQQLGYTVESTLSNYDFNFYIKLAIQGNIKTPQKMNDLIDDVIKEGEKQIADASEATFNQWKDISKIQDQWIFATKTEYVFKLINNRQSFIEKDIDSILAPITKDDLLKKYKAIFYDHDIHKISIQIYNNDPQIVFPMKDEPYYLNKEITSKVSNNLNILSI